MRGYLRSGQDDVTSSRFASLIGAIEVLIAASFPLSALAHQLTLGGVGEALLMIPFAAVGTLVASRQPQNPIGWLLLVTALTATAGLDAGFYSVRAYRIDHHGLFLSRLAVFLTQGWASMLVLLPLPILFFPDGKVSRPCSAFASSSSVENAYSPSSAAVNVSAGRVFTVGTAGDAQRVALRRSQ